MLTRPPLQSFDFGHSRKSTKKVFGVGESRAGTDVPTESQSLKTEDESKKLFHTNNSTGEGCREAFFLTQLNGFPFLKN